MPKHEVSPPTDAGAGEPAERHAAALAQATDELNQALLRAEAALASLGLGVRAEVEFEGFRDHDGDPIGPVRVLAFGKFDKQWRLTYETFYEGELDGPSSSTPLLNASREVRLEAARLLPDLHAALLREAERQVAVVKNAATSVDAFVASISTNRRAP